MMITLILNGHTFFVLFFISKWVTFKMFVLFVCLTVSLVIALHVCSV